MASDYADEAMFRNGYSEVYRINIISNADHLDMMLDRLLQIADKVDLASRKQGAEAKQTGELKDAPANDNKSPGGRRRSAARGGAPRQGQRPRDANWPR